MERLACPYCGSTRVVSKGKAVRKPRGSATMVYRKAYRCIDCGKRFVEPRPFRAKQYPDEVVKVAVGLLKTLSVKKARETLQAIFGINIGRVTLFRWKKEFHHLNPVHRWAIFPDGRRQCKKCGLVLSQNEYRRGRYPSCPKSPNIKASEERVETVEKRETKQAKLVNWLPPSQTP